MEAAGSIETKPVSIHINGLLDFKIRMYPHKYPQIIKVPMIFYSVPIHSVL